MNLYLKTPSFNEAPAEMPGNSRMETREFT